MNIRHIVISAVIALAATGPQAAVMGYVQDPSGRVELHDTAGACVGDAKHAQYIANDGSKIAGCWKIAGRVVAVVFFDGDSGAIPLQAVQQPKPA